jgi:hypothetical protein
MTFDKGAVGCREVKLPEGNRFQNEETEEPKDHWKIKRNTVKPC